MNRIRWGYGLCALLMTTWVCAAENPWPAASHVPDSQPGWEQFQTQGDPDAPLDEAQGGMTARGTPVAKRNEQCFPAEERNVFSEMDMVPSGPNGALEPFTYAHGNAIDERGRDAIRGQNTWVLWGEGNEAFWGWIQERGYGLVDFLVMLDSRKRNERFRTTGMMNQPGMLSQTDPAKKLLGLYLDVADGDKILMKQPASDIDAATGRLAAVRRPPSKHPTQLFKPGDEKLYRDVLARLPQDGLDTTVYGYPSGVVGFRLFPNPDFFGNTPAAAKARQYWDERVVERPNDPYYDLNSATAADPDLVRPFRVTMSCGFCHIGPHPLNPPADPEKPEWANMSSTIGNQYWTPPALFANLTQKNNLLYQFLASQQPGTVDTSLVSTDHINNANTITAVFDVNARLARAWLNPPEKQSAANLLLTGLEDGGRPVTPRHTPRVLVDGSDSVGVIGALSRVYLNIGTHPEEWARCHNPVIGFKPQRPFSVATLRKTSVFWRVGDKYRIPYLAAFFTYPSGKTGESIVAPMKLAATQDGKAIIAAERALATQGRQVFLQNCAICHSSKQPEGFELAFSEKWASAAVPSASGSARFTLPMKFEEWESFRASPMFAEYRRRIALLAPEPQASESQGGQDAFIKDNFLSTDIRVPITLVGTNSGRAVATNAMRGQVWGDFSSDDYKNLPAVGGVRFFNPYSGAARDPWDNNDTYFPPAGGPGYYRPASLISLWATAPYLHNNALGLFNRDPSVRGRLQGFDDGIDKILSRAKRQPSATDPYGDLRHASNFIRESDPGFIYRIAEDSSVSIAAKFIPQLLTGILGRGGVAFLTLYLWIGLAVVAAILAIFARSRWTGFVFLLLAVVTAALLVLTRLDKVWGWLWIVPVAAVALAAWLLTAAERKWFSRIFFIGVAVVSLLIGQTAHRFAAGELGAIDLGPLPMGIPINLLMNINAEAQPLRLVQAVSGLTRGLLLSQRESDPKRKQQVFEKEAGLPLLGASKCPDFVLDRGHWFGEQLTPEEKTSLKAFLKTL